MEKNKNNSNSSNNNNNNNWSNSYAFGRSPIEFFSMRWPQTKTSFETIWSHCLPDFRFFVWNLHWLRPGTAKHCPSDDLNTSWIGAVGIILVRGFEAKTSVSCETRCRSSTSPPSPSSSSCRCRHNRCRWFSRGKPMVPHLASLLVLHLAFLVGPHPASLLAHLQACPRS